MEVDLVIRHPDGSLAAIEVKLSSVPDPTHTKWLANFRQRYKHTAADVRTYVFYTGDRLVPHDGHWFVPFGAILGV